MKKLILTVLIGMTCVARAQVPSLINYQGRVSIGSTNFTGPGQFRFALVDGGTNTARQAAAVATVVNGFIVGFTVTDGGSGYTAAPAVRITDVSGSNAVAQAQVDGGAVTSVTVVNPGSGYSSNPTVTIDPPPPNIVYRTYWSNGPNSVLITVTKGLYSVLLGDTTISNMAALSVDVFTNSDVRLRVWFDDSTSGLQQLSPDQRIAAVGYALMAANVPDGAITSNKLAIGAVGSAQIADGAISSSKLAAGTVTTTAIADGAVDNSKLANNSITVTAGSGLSGGGTVPLGGSVSLTALLNHDDTLVGNGGLLDLGLNLANPNTWTALQTFGAGITVTGDVQATRLNIGTGHQLIGTYATIAGGYRSTNAGDYATIGGGYRNIATNEGATVAGGEGNVAWGYVATVGGGLANTNSANFATIGGGGLNTASGAVATIAGGGLNTASGPAAAIGGGEVNTASTNYATIAGGYVNTASGEYSTVAGGYGNTASGPGAFIGGGGFNGTYQVGPNVASGPASVIGGGMFNQAATNYATVAGGYTNIASGYASVIGGGARNTATTNYATIGGGCTNTASGHAATVAGGYNNTAAGDYSFAAGLYAMATNYGAFVWSSGGEYTYSWGYNTFTVRAHGGARFYTASGTNTGVHLPAGGGAWSSLSDRNAKENFQPVDCHQILERVAALPITTWNYKTQPATIRHIGPIAQDFAAAFGVGEDDRCVSTVDAEGVALAAIKGLYEELQAEKARNEALEKRLAELERKLGKGGN